MLNNILSLTSVASMMMVTEISIMDQENMVTIKTLVEKLVKITSYSLFKTEDGALVITPTVLQKVPTTKETTTTVTVVVKVSVWRWP